MSSAVSTKSTVSHLWRAATVKLQKVSSNVTGDKPLQQCSKANAIPTIPTRDNSAKLREWLIPLLNAAGFLNFSKTG